MNEATRAEVLEAVNGERDYQEGKYEDHYHAVGEWLLLMEEKLRTAKAAWYRSGREGCTSAALHEVRKVAAVAVACLEQHGAPRREVIVQACRFCEGKQSFPAGPNGSDRYRCPSCDGSGKAVDGSSR